MNEDERIRLARVAAQRSESSPGTDAGWETKRCNAIGSLWGRGDSAAVEIVGVEPWVLRAEMSR